MKIDLTCPVELWQYAMPTENASECTFVLNNLSSKVVTSVMLTLAAYDKENNLLFRQSERTQGLKAGVGERFTILFLPTQWENVESTDLIIEKVWFDDATVWRKGNAPLVHYSSNQLASSRALDELRFVAGRDAVGYPELQEQVWVCVCGRANHPDALRCCRCDRGRDYVFASLSRENISQIIAVHEKKLSEVAREARVENSRLVEADHMMRKRKKKKLHRVVALCTASVLLAAGAVATWLWGIPALKYQNAIRQMENGNYDTAAAAFASMGDYGDASDMTTECGYRSAVALYEAGDTESLLAAIEGFEAIPEYKDSADIAKKARYQLGENYLAEGMYEKAMEQFQSLGEYEDAASRSNECVYKQAQVLAESGNVKTALVLYQMVPDYLDSAERAKECYYRLGKTEVDNGNDAEAASLFLSAGDYLDAPEQRKAAIYRQAETCEENEELLRAGELYLSLGIYEDAQSKGNDCVYRYAAQMLEAEDYVAAASAFEMIPTYLDSADQIQFCYYQQGVSQMDMGFCAAAVPFFEKCGEYSDSADRLKECYFRMGIEAAGLENYADAELYFEKAGDYEGASDKLADARYRNGIALMQSGNYALAAEKFKLLGDYEDSSDMWTRSLYQQGVAAYEGADYAQAVACFGQILTYEDSREYYNNAALEVANGYENGDDAEAALLLLPGLDPESEAAKKLTELVLNEGLHREKEEDFAGAAKLYEALPDNEEAAKRLPSCRYRQAVQLRDEGKTREAADAFAALGEYEDAPTLARECYGAIYGNKPETARKAMKEKNYAAVILALKDVDMDDLPATFSDLAEIYPEALYEYANELYQQDRPYEAIPFYLAAEGYGDTGEKLSRRAYLILGSWESSGGLKAEFRLDGSCNINGRECFFRVSNFSLLIGDSPEKLGNGFQIFQLTEKGMSIRELHGDERTYKYTRTAEVEMPTAIPYEMLESENAAADGEAVEEAPSEEEEYWVVEE